MRAVAVLAVLLPAGVLLLAPRLLECRGEAKAREIARAKAAVSFHALAFRDLGNARFEADHFLYRGDLALDRLDLTTAQTDFRRVIELGAWTPSADVQNRVEAAWERLRRVDAMLEDR